MKFVTEINLTLSSTIIFTEVCEATIKKKTLTVEPLKSGVYFAEPEVILI